MKVGMINGKTLDPLKHNEIINVRVQLDLIVGAQEHLKYEVMPHSRC
jgi:hypothetical protein